MRALSLISWILVMVLVVGHIMSVGTADAQDRTILTDQAVAYQINPSHTGFVKTGPPPPLQKRWEVDLGGPISYPLIAEGKVFVTVSNTSTYGTRLYALDAATGQVVWGPINISGTYYWSNAAYEAGRVFVVNFDGLLKAFDAGTGTLLWSRQLPGQYAFSSPPAAFEGIVYTGGAGSGGTVYAVDAENGAVLWTAPVENGDHSSPAISLDGVYVSYACAQAYKFDRLTGALLWHYSTSCSGGGGRTPVYYCGRLYVRDWATSPSGYILDSETGNLLGHYDAYNDPSPAVDGDLGVFLNYGTLEVRNLETGAVMWSFAGDGGLSSAPIIVNRFVYIGSTSGNLYALDPRSGQEVWSTNVGVGIPGPDEHNVSQPLTGLGAGEGLLVIPAGNLLIAFESHFDTVQEIYIGYFQRPADPGGLIYWTERLDATGGNLTEIIEAFANSAESQALYGTINSSNISTVVNSIYNALFGRDAEIEGLNWYVNGFNSGQYTPATIMLNVLYGAQNEDLQSVNNKLAAANLFTWTIDPDLDGASFLATYSGDADAQKARDFLSTVGWDAATIPTQADVTLFIKNNIADPGDPILNP